MQLVKRSLVSLYFYPRPPRGGRRLQSEKQKRADQFLSTPSAGRATQSNPGYKFNNDISIHALRGEGDLRSVCARCKQTVISIHALRGEGD